jgi:hypothetical protein
MGRGIENTTTVAVSLDRLTRQNERYGTPENSRIDIIAEVPERWRARFDPR